MPSKTDRKKYLENATYHIYNRGVNKQIIFYSDDAFADYARFVSICKQEMNNFPGLKVHAFALMPNHFHMVISQKSSHTISHLMKRVCQRYVRYFNRKYNRIGPLFQGRYQAALLKKPTRIYQATRYVLDNPNDAGIKNWRYVGRNIEDLV